MARLWHTNESDHKNRDSTTSMLIMFHNTPLWWFALCACLVKNFSQNPVKKQAGEKRASHVALVTFLETLREKTQWKETHQGKIVQQLIFKVWSLDHIYGPWFRELSPPEPSNLLSLLMPIPWRHRWKLDVGEGFVNKSAKFSQAALLELMRTKEFLEQYVLWDCSSHSPFCIWSIQATLSS